MHRLVAATTLALLATFAQTHAGTKIEDLSKSCPVEAPEAIGVGPYVSVFGGVNVHQSGDLDTRFLDWDLQPDTGWLAGLKLGYAFKTNSFLLPAVELEGFYNRLDFEQTAHVEDRYRSEFLRVDHEDSYKITADVHAAAIMLNGLLRFDLGRFRPYIGGGIGVAHVWFKNGKFDIKHRSEYRGEFISDSFSYRFSGHFNDVREWSFAAQGIAGFELYATKRISVFAEYKALWLRDAVQVSDYVNHLVAGGVRLYF